MSKRRDSGTYLFVKEGKRKKTDRAPRTKSVERPIDAERLRYQRPTLDPSRVDGRLVFFFEPDGPVADAYRGVAEQVLAGRPPDRRIRLTSPRPEAGRTTTALNLASALAVEHRVTVIDLDLEGPGVARAFGLVDPPCLTEMVLARKSDPRAPLDLVMIADGLAVLPVRSKIDSLTAAALLAEPELERILAEVAVASDLVIIDGPAALPGDSMQALLALVKGTLLVVRPEAMTSDDYERTLEALAGGTVVGALLNAAPEPDIAAP